MFFYYASYLLLLTSLSSLFVNIAIPLLLFYLCSQYVILAFVKGILPKIIYQFSFTLLHTFHEEKYVTVPCIVTLNYPNVFRERNSDLNLNICHQYFLLLNAWKCERGCQFSIIYWRRYPRQIDTSCFISDTPSHILAAKIIYLINTFRSLPVNLKVKTNKKNPKTLFKAQISNRNTKSISNLFIL